MYSLKIIKPIKKMSLNDIRYFIFEKFYKWIRFSKEDTYYSSKRLKRKYLLLFTNKLKEKVPDPRNAKEHYESFVKKKNKNSVKQPKSFDIVHKKLDITEHPKTSHKLSKIIRKGEKADSNSSLYSDTKKCKFFERKKYKNNKTRTFF